MSAAVLVIRLVFLLAGVLLATFYPFASVIFLDRGFDAVEIGVVTAVGALVFAVSVPIWGHLADVRLGRPGALRVATLGSGLALAAFGLPWPALVLALMYLAFTATESAVAPLTDAIAVNALARPERDYPAIRLLTSLSFAGVSIACGFLYDATGYWPSTLLYAGVAVVLALVAGWAPDRPRADLDHFSTAKRRGGSFRLAFAVQPRLPGILLAILLVQIGVIGGFTFLGLRIIELGGNPSDVALSAGISALAEVPSMLIAGRLIGRLGLRGVFSGGAAIYALTIASWAVLDSPVAIVGTRIITGFAFSSLWIASVLTMQRLLPDRLQATGQGLYQTTAFGVAAVIANLGGGILIAEFGTGPFFLLIAGIAGAAAVVAWFALPARRETAPRWDPAAEGLDGPAVATTAATDATDATAATGAIGAADATASAGPEATATLVGESAEP
jgi:PPP family 3-phenylpropionic acid transporter